MILIWLSEFWPFLYTRWYQENTNNNSSVLFCISQFSGVLPAVPALDPWWRPKRCQPRLAPPDFTFSVEGVAISCQLLSAPAPPERGEKSQTGQGAALHGEKNQGDPPSARVGITGVGQTLKPPKSTNQLNLNFCQFYFSLLPQYTTYI